MIVIFTNDSVWIIDDEPICLHVNDGNDVGSPSESPRLARVRQPPACKQASTFSDRESQLRFQFVRCWGIDATSDRFETLLGDEITDARGTPIS